MDVNYNIYHLKCLFVAVLIWPKISQISNSNFKIQAIAKYSHRTQRFWQLRLTQQKRNSEAHWRKNKTTIYKRNRRKTHFWPTRINTHESTTSKSYHTELSCHRVCMYIGTLEWKKSEVWYFDWFAQAGLINWVAWALLARFCALPSYIHIYFFWKLVHLSCFCLGSSASGLGWTVSSLRPHTGNSPVISHCGDYRGRD